MWQKWEIWFLYFYEATWTFNLGSELFFFYIKREMCHFVEQPLHNACLAYSLEFMYLTRYLQGYHFLQLWSRMAGHRIAHPTLKGPSLVKEICIGITLGLAFGGLWKMHHWNEQKKVRSFYDLLQKGEIGVVVPEE